MESADETDWRILKESAENLFVSFLAITIMFKRVGLPVPDGYPEVDNTETDNPKITRLNNN